MRFEKLIKELILKECAIKIPEEEYGIVVEVFPIEFGANDEVHLGKTCGVCHPKFDSFQNLVGCEDVDACSKGCDMSAKIDPDTGDVPGYFCRYGKSPDKEKIDYAWETPLLPRNYDSLNPYPADQILI